MLDIFDILGPVMVGPSSSHTAGAVRIGRMARVLLGDAPVEARIGLFGSFAETGQGLGTDRALVAGLLGMKPDDLEIPHSFSLAEERGLRFSFYTANLREAHPNTAVLEVRDAAGGVHRRRENPGGPAQRCGRQLYRNVQHSGSAASGYCRKGGGCDPGAFQRQNQHRQYERMPGSAGRRCPDGH